MLNRRGFLGMLCCTVATLAVGVSAKEKQETVKFKWSLDYDPLKQGIRCIFETTTPVDVHGDHYYCAFLISPRDLYRHYTLDEMWCVYGKPATIAVYRELNRDNVEEQRGPFEECLGTIRLWTNPK